MPSEIEWKIVSALSRPILSRADLGDKFFNVSPNTGFYRQFSAPLKYAYVPLVLQPAASYYNYIHQRARNSNQIFAEKKLPFYIDVPTIVGAKVTINFRLYPPNILAMTVRLRSLREDMVTVPFDTLFTLRKPRSLPIIRDLIHWSVDLISERSGSDPAIPFTETYAGLHFSDVNKDYWENGRKRLIGLLIGNRNYNEMDMDVVNNISAKSAELNKKKPSHEHLMINKQGTLLFTRNGENSTTPADKLYRAMDLAEIAMVYQSFLDNVYPESRTGQAEGFLDYIFTRVRAWIEQPEAILNVSYTNTLHWKLLATEFGLHPKLELMQRENPWLSRALAAKSEHFARLGNNWWNNDDFASAFSGNGN